MFWLEVRVSTRETLFVSGWWSGVVWKGQSCDGILELGKLVMGLRKSEGGVVPLHDGA